MHAEAEGHQDPREPWRGENKDPQETKSRVWVPPGPDVNERAGEGRAQEGEGCGKGAEGEEGGGGI